MSDIKLPSAPSITVGIPAYNCAATIERAVASVQAQKRIEADEVLVVDDGSTDATARIVRDLQKADPRIRLVSHKTNRGRAAARNTVLEGAGGELLAWLDADDTWHPEKLDAQYAILERERQRRGTNNLIVYAGYQTQRDDGDAPLVHRVQAEFGLFDLLELLERPRSRTYPLTQTFLGPAETMRRARYDGRLNWSEDTDYLLGFLGQGGVLVGDPDGGPLLTYYRSTRGKARVMERSFATLFAKHGDVLAEHGLSSKRLLADRLFTSVANAYRAEGSFGGYWRNRLAGAVIQPGRLAPRLVQEVGRSALRKLGLTC